MTLRCCLIASCAFGIMLSGNAEPTGFVEGHLKILPHGEANLADDGGVTEATAENYADYPLLVLAADSGKEIARARADEKGNYRIELPPGNYVLDVQGRAPKRLRARPRPFTIESTQVVRVDLEIDTGVR